MTGGEAALTPHARVQENIDATRAPLLLLHGSDGTELDLLPLAREVAPFAPRLAMRGTLAMEGGYGFFRRSPDRVIDAVDLATRVPSLSRTVREIRDDVWPGRQPLLLGYSNGAIMGAALLQADPELLAGAILLRGLLPPLPGPELRMDGVPVLIVDGENDQRRSGSDGHALADRLGRLGAEVTHRVLPVGHPITDADREIIRSWLQHHDF